MSLTFAWAGWPTSGHGVNALSKGGQASTVLVDVCLVNCRRRQHSTSVPAVAMSAVAVCPNQPGPIDNATFACAPSSIYGAKCTAKCLTGFKAGSAGAPTTWCVGPNTWSTISGSCVPIGELPAAYLG